MSYYLETVIPPLKRLGRLPLSRDQVMLLMVAINELLLGVEIYLAHSLSGTIVPNEWLPIYFGAGAGALLLITGFLSLKARPVAAVIASLVLITSIAVGFLGGYLHIVRAFMATAPAGEQVSVELLIWGPPVLAPLTYGLVGVLGLSALFNEEPADSGRLILPRGHRLQMPLSKSRVFFLLVGLGILATLISSVLDHSRTHFDSVWLWLPTGVGVLGTVVAIALAMIKRPTRVDLTIFAIVMLLVIAVGLVGGLLHVQESLTRDGVVVAERFIHGAPPLAPMLFADMGTLGLIVLLDPRTSHSM